MSSIENWDDDFSGELTIPPHIQNDETVLKEQLGQVKSFASIMQEIEQLLLSITSINDALKNESIQNALELIILSKHDQNDEFFTNEISKEYLLNYRNSESPLEFLRTIEKNDDTESNDDGGTGGELNVDMLTVKRLTKKADELIPKLKNWVHNNER